MTQINESLVMLTLVILLHAGILGFFVNAQPPKTLAPPVPIVQGILVSAPTSLPFENPVDIPTPVEPQKPEPQKPEIAKPVTKPQKMAPVLQKPRVTSELQNSSAAPIETPPVASEQPKSEAEQAGPITPPREDAEQLSNPRPAYPSLSRRLREEGTVILEILILVDGTVDEIRINQSSGFKRLDDAAIKAVKSWRYVPAKQGDEAISFWYLQPLEFSLN